MASHADQNSSRSCFRYFRALAILLLVSCGGGTSPVFVDTTANVSAPGVPIAVDGQRELRADGGTVSIDAADSPIKGAKVVIFADTLTEDSETITITYQDELPAPLNADAMAFGGKTLSKVLVLSRTGSLDFGKAVSVTIPFDKTALAADAVPVVVFWDESINSYSPVTISAIDRDNGTVTFLTSHFSKYAVIVLDKLFGATKPSTASMTYDVGFVPNVDGFFVRNFGSYDSPGGNSFGMAAYSAWYHKSKKASRGAGLMSLYKEGDPVLEEDDETARELITRAYQAGDQRAHLLALDNAGNMNFPTRALGDRHTAYSMLTSLMITRQAQILTMGVGSGSKWTKGHAVTVYAYDGAKKVFQFYDNNFPGEVVELSWDPDSGFGTYPIKNVTWDRFAFASFNQAYSPATMSRLFDGAENGWSSARFPKISISAPFELPTVKNTFEVASDDNVVISGSVPRAPQAANTRAQRYVHVYVNGAKFGSGFPVSNLDNSFSISVAKLPTASGTDVMLLVSEHKDSWRSVFTAFKQFKLRVANQFFFKNFGFETGNFDNWTSERHLWGGGGSVVPSDDSVFASSGGLDPIATDLPTSLFGKGSARINNEANGSHISTLSQSAVVPIAANPVVRFYWAAVLEDPQHSPKDQPYVEVSVVNQTKGIELYRKKFYTNDPSYPGWKPYRNGQWKSIPWQFVELAAAAHIGDTLTLKVEAADCALGGHGGYAYLDAEE